MILTHTHTKTKTMTKTFRKHGIDLGGLIRPGRPLDSNHPCSLSPHRTAISFNSSRIHFKKRLKELYYWKQRRLKMHLQCTWSQPICLGEAIHLARDFGYVCETEFPARQVSAHKLLFSRVTSLWKCSMLVLMFSVTRRFRSDVRYWVTDSLFADFTDVTLVSEDTK